MSKLIETAEAKDAIGFQDALHAAISEKVAVVLDSLRETVAEDLFADKSEETK